MIKLNPRWLGGALQFSRSVVVSQRRRPEVFSGAMPFLVLEVFVPAIKIRRSI
jgi:TRAP-type mannitol/chloroaromatic compound transport system permease large subunit